MEPVTAEVSEPVTVEVSEPVTAEVSVVDEDIKELKLFLGQAQRPRVKELLQDDIKKLEAEASAASASPVSKAPELPVEREETVPAAPQPEPQQKRIPTKTLDTYGECCFIKKS
jgi:hypothetical protein